MPFGNHISASCSPSAGAFLAQKMLNPYGNFEQLNPDQKNFFDIPNLLGKSAGSAQPGLGLSGLG